MQNVDGFVLSVPQKKLKLYRSIAQKAGNIWREHGALQYVEAVGEDLEVKFGMSFRKAFKPKSGETIIFSWIVYKSRTHRDKVNAKVMSDPRLRKIMENSEMPFDMKRMVYGGFQFLVNA